MRTLLFASLISVAALAAAAAFLLPGLYADEFAGEFTQPPTAWATSDTCAGLMHPGFVQRPSCQYIFHRKISGKESPPIASAPIRSQLRREIPSQWLRLVSRFPKRLSIARSV